MKFSLLKNDKNTALDELLMVCIIITSFVVGLVIFCYAPGFWIIQETTVKVFGIVWMFFAAMLVPALIYRLLTNNR